MKYIFGPIPSRRLGQSLGIDTVPLKTCNWNCVYCQLGRSVPMTSERREYFPRADILAEVEQVLATNQTGEIDWVTFVGAGEPTHRLADSAGQGTDYPARGGHHQRVAALPA